MGNYRNFVMTILIFALLFTCQSCGSAVYTVSDKDGYAKVGFRQGYTSMEDYDDFRKRQERSKTLNILEGQIRQAVVEKNDKELETLLTRKKKLENYLDGISGVGNSFANVKLINKYSQTVKIEDGAFRGEVLKPGEETKYKKQIPIGSYSFRVSSTNNRGKYKTVVVKRIIARSEKAITLKAKKY